MITDKESARRFQQGQSAGQLVSESHAPSTAHMTSIEQQAAFFWFYVGVLATGEFGCREQEDFEPFMAGAAPWAPILPPSGDDELAARRQ